MAVRSLLTCLSHSLRQVQEKIPRLSDHPPSQLLWSQIDGCSVSSYRVPQLGGFNYGGPSNRSVSSVRTLSFLSNLLSTSLLSLNRRELGSPVRTSGQTVSYSISAVAIEEDETVQLAAEIGYEVLGQYVPESAGIKPQAAFAVVQFHDKMSGSVDNGTAEMSSVSIMKTSIKEAALKVGSHQFKVTPGDMIYTEKLKYADINDKLLLNKVLLLGSLKQTIIGRPTVPEAGVLAAVEEIALDEKVIVFKKKRRKNYRRTNGHRQELTRLRILQLKALTSGLDNHA